MLNVAPLAHIVRISNGDARIALNALELAAMTAGGTITEKPHPKGKSYY